MTIKNLTKNTVLSKDAKFAKSFKNRLFGLLLKSNPGTLIFKTRFGIHTFFLREPIDILILDSNKKVIKLKKDLKPNKFFFWNPKFQIVIELPCKTIINTKTTHSDKLDLS